MPWAECWVHGSVRAALRAARVLGLAPIRIEERVNRADRIAVSTACVLYGKVMNVAIASLAVIATGRFAYNNMHGALFSRSSIWYLTLMLEVCATSLVAGVAGVDGARRMGRFINTIKEIRKINFINNIKKLTKDSFGEHWVWLMIIWAFAFQVSSLTIIFYALGENVEHLVSCVLMYMPFFSKVFVTLEYVCLTSVLNSSLLALHNSLNEIAVELSLKEDYDNVVYKKSYETVKGANCSYLSMYGIVKKFNKQDGVLVLILFGSTVIRTVRCFYLFVSSLNTQANVSIVEKINTVIAMGWIIFEISQIVLMIETCYRTTEMLNSMRYVVGECLINASPGGMLAEELTNFQQTLEMTSVSFSPLDICTFSRSVMIALLSFYITVAAVMRQFNLKD